MKYLDKEEKELIESYKKGEWKPIKKGIKKFTSRQLKKVWQRTSE